jgi:hypothetical protein
MRTRVSGLTAKLTMAQIDSTMQKRTSDDLVSRVRISEIWTALGGEPPRHGRARAFWRPKADALNVSLDDGKGTWYDFRDSVGGGVLDLIQHVHGGRRQDALRWLADYRGVLLADQQMTEVELREWAQRRRAAEAEAQRLVWWKNDILDVLRQHRDMLLQTYHSATRFLLHNPLDDCERRGLMWKWELAFDAAYEYWPKIERLDRQIDLLASAPYSELLKLYRERQTAA